MPASILDSWLIFLKRRNNEASRSLRNLWVKVRLILIFPFSIRKVKGDLIVALEIDFRAEFQLGEPAVFVVYLKDKPGLAAEFPGAVKGDDLGFFFLGSRTPMPKRYLITPSLG